MLLDGDDEYIDVVDDGIEFLNEHPDFVAVAYNFIEFYEKKSVYKKVQDPYPKKIVFTYFAHCARRRYFSSNCLVFRRNVALDAISEDSLYCNDTFLTKLLLKSGFIYYIGRETMIYRKEIPSIYSGASRATRILSELMIQEECLRSFPDIRGITKENIKMILRRASSEKGVLDDVSYKTQAKSRRLRLSLATYEMMASSNLFMRWLLRIKLSLIEKRFLK